MEQWDINTVWDQYSCWWRQGLKELLRWPEWRIEEWCLVQKLRMLVGPRGSPFFHRKQEYYLAEALIPSFKTLREGGINPHALHQRVSAELEAGFANFDARARPNYDWGSARKRVEAVLKEFDLIGWLNLSRSEE